MPLPGGQTDKFGNRYEGRWTVFALLEVLEGKFDSLRLEPPGDAGDGVEFWLRKDGHFDYHQVKRQDVTEGRWTLNGLQQKRVLAHFLSKLNDPNATCHFVSIQDAYQLRELAERAGQAQTFTEFEREYLKAEQHSNNFSLLCSHWAGSSRQDVYEKLKRVQARTIDEATLQSMLEWRLETLVEGATPATVVDSLAQFALDKIGHELTAHDLWRKLESIPCRRRDWSNDSNVLAAVDQVNNRYLSNLQSEAINGKMISRDEATTAVEKMVANSHISILLAGEAGGGKSCVLAQTTTQLQKLGWPVIAFRIDRLSPTQLPNQVGEQLGLPGSPAHVLATIAQGRDCALVIDQLDAVSLVSGRHPEFFDCVSEIIRQSLIHPKMRLVLGCRKFDIDNDHRLRRLAEKAYGAEVIQVSHLSHDTVRQVVSDLGLDAQRLTVRQLDLLSIPLHLNLLARIAADNATNLLNFETVKNLYDYYWDEKERAVRKRLGSSAQWTQVLDKLCEVMSAKQVLSVPASKLDDYEADARALVAEHVLTLDNRRYAFFHESFFDYVFARRFVAKEQRLVDLLLSGEQHLFRRAQVRQILLHEREADRTHYLADLRSLLTHPSIRFHLKQVVFALLATLPDPTEPEWDIIAPFLNDQTNSLRMEVWVLLNQSPAWARLLDSMGLIEQWLSEQEDEERVNRTIQLLTSAQKAMPERVAELLEPYVGVSEDWNQRLSYAMDRTDKGAGRRFFDLFLRLIDEGVLDEARNQFVMNGDFWMLTYSLPKERPDWAAEVIGHYCNRYLERSLAAGDSNPFGNLLGIPDSQHDDRYLLETAEGAPLEFVEQLLPFMLRVMQLTARKGSKPPCLDDVWCFRFIGEGYSFRHALLMAMEKALSLLAANAPDSFVPIAEQLRRSEFETVQYLLIRAYAANGERFANEAVDYLCNDPARFRTGYSDDSHWASRQLIEAVTPFCSDDHLQRLEEKLLDYYPEWEHLVDKDSQRRRGYYQFELLDGIVASRQSDRVRRRLGEWQRKFNRQTVTPPRGIIGGFVDSPIPENGVTKMTDEQWLNAIARYKVGERPFREDDDFLKGGAQELAAMIGNQAKLDPPRFAKLLCNFPLSTHPVYFDSVLRGIAEGDLDPSILADLCEHCHQLPQRPSGQWVCWLVGKQAKKVLPESVIDIIAWYAIEDPNPENELWRVDAGHGQSYYGGEIETYAINTVRGSAAETIAYLLFADGNRLPQLLPVLRKMVNDPSLAVRSCVAEALTAMLNNDRDTAVELFLQLCETENDLLQTRGIERFLRYGLKTHYQQLLPILERMLDCDFEKARMAGARLACLTSLDDEAARGLAQRCLNGIEADRIGAAQVFAANLRSARYRAYCEGALIALFNDSAKKVREEAARCFSHFKDDELAAYTDLINNFVFSEAFMDNHRNLFHAMEETTAKLPEITCAVCERFLETSGVDAADVRTHAAAESYQVTELLVRTYRQYQNEAVQSRCLDLLDRLAQARVLGMEKAFSDFER